MSLSDWRTLLALADSRLPAGGHAHSGGVEEAVDQRPGDRPADAATPSCAAGFARTAWSPRRSRPPVHRGELSVAEHGRSRETDARTPAPAARQASRGAGPRVWPGWRGGSGRDVDWDDARRRSRTCAVGGRTRSAPCGGLAPEQTALSLVYTHDDGLGDRGPAAARRSTRPTSRR